MGNKFGKRKEKVELISVKKTQLSLQNSPNNNKHLADQNQSQEQTNVQQNIVMKVDQSPRASPKSTVLEKDESEKTLEKSESPKSFTLGKSESPKSSMLEKSESPKPCMLGKNVIASPMKQQTKVIGAKTTSEKEGLNSDDVVLTLDGNEEYVMRFYDTILANAYQEVIGMKKKEYPEENEKYEEDDDSSIITQHVVEDAKEDKNINEETSHQTSKENVNCRETSVINSGEMMDDDEEIEKLDSKENNSPETNRDNETETISGAMEQRLSKNDITNNGEISILYDGETCEHETYLHYGEKLSMHIMTHVKLHLA